MQEKIKAIFTATMILCVVGVVGVTADVQIENDLFRTVTIDLNNEVETNEGGVAGSFIGLVISLVLAMKLAPTLFNETTTLETDTAEDLDTSEESLIGLIPLFVIFGLIGIVVGGIAI